MDEKKDEDKEIKENGNKKESEEITKKERKWKKKDVKDNHYNLKMQANKTKIIVTTSKVPLFDA